MSLYLSLSVCVCLSISVFMSLHLCLCLCFFVSLSLHLCLCVSASVFLSLCLCISVCLSVSPCPSADWIASIFASSSFSKFLMRCDEVGSRDCWDTLLVVLGVHPVLPHRIISFPASCPYFWTLHKGKLRMPCPSLPFESIFIFNSAWDTGVDSSCSADNGSIVSFSWTLVLVPEAPP